MNNTLYIMLLFVPCIAHGSQSTSKAPSTTISISSTPRTIAQGGFERITPRPANPIGRELLFGTAVQPSSPLMQHRRRNQEVRRTSHALPQRPQQNFPIPLPASQHIGARINTASRTIPTILPAAIQRSSSYLEVARRNS